jgi:hypothetical protein
VGFGVEGAETLGVVVVLFVHKWKEKPKPTLYTSLA